jgi:hypothetical protein
MHWPFAAEILTLGCISFSIIYLYYLIKNGGTNWTDFIKLLFISAISVELFLKIFHFPYSEEISLLGILFLLILIINLIKAKKIYLDNK